MDYRKLIDDLEDSLIRLEPATLLIYIGLNNDGEQNIDIEVVEGHCIIDGSQYLTIADDAGNETLREAFVSIVSQLEQDDTNA